MNGVLVGLCPGCRDLSYGLGRGTKEAAQQDKI